MNRTGASAGGAMTTPQPDLYLLIGHPVSHLRVAGHFNAGLEANAQSGRMEPRDVAPEGLGDFVGTARAMSRLRGFLVSRPHKQTILPLLDRLTPAAETAGLANIVRRECDGSLTGHQLDGPGFIVGMRANGFDPAGSCVFIQGAGGVAAAIGHALAEAGARRILVANRTTDRAESLVRRLAGAFSGTCSFEAVARPAEGVDAAINATSLGTEDGDPLPFDPSTLGKAVFVADLVNRADATALERAARAKGLRFQSGRDAVAPQYALMHEFFAAH